jgi:hypothetical protein
MIKPFDFAQDRLRRRMERAGRAIWTVAPTAFTFSSLRLKSSEVTVSNSTMSPDKLFDYLDGKLPAGERAELEERLISNPELRRELAVARQIHSQIGHSSEGFLDLPDSTRGPFLVRRIVIAFSVLVFINVVFGIYAIAFMDKKRRAQRNETQNRSEISQSLSRTAAAALPTPTLGIEEITFSAPVAEQDTLANTVIIAAQESGGSGTKGLADEHGILIFAEIPTQRLNDFRQALRKLGGAVPAPAAEPSAGEKTILQLRISSSP